MEKYVCELITPKSRSFGYHFPEITYTYLSLTIDVVKNNYHLQTNINADL